VSSIAAAGNHLLRAVTMLGIILFLAYLVFPSAPQFPTFTAPSFVNPFDRTTELSSYSFIPVHNDHANLSAVSTNFVGCFGNESWTCVQDLNSSDGPQSYVVMRNPALDVNNSIFMDLSPAIVGRTIFASYDIWCQFNGTITDGAYVIPTLWKWNGTGYSLIEGNTLKMESCGNGFFAHTTALSYTCNNGTGGACGESDSSLYNTPFSLQLAVQSPLTNDSWTISISTARVTIGIGIINGSTTCNGDFFANLSCQFTQFWNFLSKLGQYLINGIGFIFAWGSLFFSAVTTLIQDIIWLYSIPGVPTLVQLLINVYVSSNIIYFIYAVALLIRGSASG